MTQRTPNPPGFGDPARGRTATGHPSGAPAQAGSGIDVISKNQGDNVRKVHARELAANVVTALFRLVKVSTLHSLDNQAMVRQVEDTVRLVAEYGQRTDHNVSILFAHGSVFVGGQLLRANRGVYEGALELGEILGKVGAAEIGIRREVQANDFLAFASLLTDALRKPKPPKIERVTPNIRMRGLAASALLRENILSERVEPNVQVARTYASAVVIMRRFFEDLRRGKYELPQRVKRVAQRLVDLSMGETPAFLGVTAARNQNYDEAGRAVNTAILALAMTRQLAPDTVQLSRIAMASLLYDCARARIAGVVGVGGPAVIPNFSEQQELEAAAGTAVVLTALGRINEPSVMRTVISYEAHWERRRDRLGPVYRGLRAPSLQARILNIARAFNDLLTPAPGQMPPSADDAIAKIEQSAADSADRTVLRLLIGALGIFTTGTIVRLNSGETGIVVETPSHPSLYSQPKVRLVLDANHGWLQPPVEFDLAHQGRRRAGETQRHIKEVVATADDPAGAQLRAYAAGPVATSLVRQATVVGLTAASPPPHVPDPPSSPGLTNPPSYQVTPPSFQQPLPAQAPQPPFIPQPPTPAPQVQYAQSGAAPVITMGGQAVSSGLAAPTAKGRATTLASPFYEPPPQPSRAAGVPSFYEDAGASPAVHDEGDAGLSFDLVTERMQRPYEVQAEALEAQPYEAQAQAEVYDLQPYEVQPYEAQPQDAQPYQAQPYEAQPYQAQPYEAQPYEAQPHEAQPHEAQPYEAQPYEAQPYEAQSYQAQPYQAQPYEAQDSHGHATPFDDDDEGTAATRAVSWEDQARLFGRSAPQPVEEAPAPPPSPPLQEARVATAEGVLQKTPFVHLLIYMLDQRLSGTTVFTLSNGVSHAVYFHDGTPAKVRTGGMIEPLDRVLVDLGMLDESTLRGTLMEVSKKNILHGRLLVMKGLLSREKVVEALRVQVLRKVTHLFELPGDTRYAYYKDENLLASYGGPELTPTEPLATIMAGIRLMAGDPLVDATLNKIVGRPLGIHIDAEMRRFSLTREEQAVADLLRTRRMTLKELVFANVAQEQVVRLTIYALVVTRHVDLGVAGKAPVGLGRPPVASEVIVVPQSGVPSAPTPAPVTPMAPSSPPADAPAEAAPSGRVRSTLLSAGQAAPVSSPRRASVVTTVVPSSRPSATPVPPAALYEAQPPPRPVPPPAAPVRAAAPAAPVQPAAPAQLRPELAARRAEVEARAQAIDSEDYFHMLGVGRDATVEQIAAAYRGMAKAWHPDRLPAELFEVKPQTARVFARLSEAFQTLSDANKRKEYLDVLSQGGGTPDDQEKVARVVDAAFEFQKAEILMKKNDLAGAEQLAARAVAADPDQPDYLTLLVWLRAMRRGDPPELREGQQSTHYDDLIKTLDVILAKEKDYERGLYYRGVLLKRSGKLERAIRDFRMAAQLNPKNIDAVREVRLYEMRKSKAATAPAAKPVSSDDGGRFGKFFKR